MTNVTISGNVSGWGAVLTQPGTTNSFTNCTIVDNQSTTPGASAGISGNGSSYHNVRNTILSNNINTNYGSYNCSQVQNSLGYNISSDGSCFFNQTGDLQNTDPLLANLQDNGGPTFTHALTEGSPAIDAGDPANFPATDQRGIARPADGNKDGNAVCDIGSYELKTSYSVGGMVMGLAPGNNVVLQNNLGDDVTVTADGSFVFSTPLDDGSTYAVTVLTQPADPDQFCKVTNGTGTISGGNVTDVNVECIDRFFWPMFLPAITNNSEP